MRSEIVSPLTCSSKNCVRFYFVIHTIEYCCNVQYFMTQASYCVCLVILLTNLFDWKLTTNTWDCNNLHPIRFSTQHPIVCVNPRLAVQPHPSSLFNEPVRIVNVCSYCRNFFVCYTEASSYCRIVLVLSKSVRIVELWVRIIEIWVRVIEVGWYYRSLFVLSIPVHIIEISSH